MKKSPQKKVFVATYTNEGLKIGLILGPLKLREEEIIHPEKSQLPRFKPKPPDPPTLKLRQDKKAVLCYPNSPLVCPWGELGAEGKSLPLLAPDPSRETKIESVERFA